MAALDPEVIGRFRRDLEVLTGEAPSPARMLGIAVSGGPDSMALLLLAAAAWPGAIRAATVDHGLRPESAAEARAVAAHCARIGVPHHILTLRPDAPGGNLQERARTGRYRALADWAMREQPIAPWVAVAHHRDDVAETFLARARRGAGAVGLAEMPRARPLHGTSGTPATLVRPLLGWTRAELAAIVAAAGITPIADPSNLHPRFDRSRIRALLAATPELPPARLALAARNLRHAEDALDWLAEREWATRAEVEAGTVRVAPSDLPYEIRRRLALKAIRFVRFGASVEDDWPGTGLDRLVAALDSGEGGTLAGVQARPKGNSWLFTPEPPRRSH